MKKLTILLGLTVIHFSQTAFAQVSADEFQVLREQIQFLTQRLDELEKATRQTTPNLEPANETTVAPVNELIKEKINKDGNGQFSERMAAVSWAERMRWKGDFRYRYENIKVEGTDSRNRIRARIDLEADVSETVQVGLGFATGGEDPVSSNQTLGGGGSTKDLRLDLAYFDWSGLADTHILGGKVRNFLVRAGKNGLMWDDDWRPEGIGANWNNGTFFAHGIGTWIASDSNSNKDNEFAWIAQAGMNFKLGDSTEFRIGAAYAQFNPAGSGSLFGDDDDFFGNSFDPDTLTYLYDYHEIEAFAEITFDLFDRPLMLFADYVTNTAVGENDSGYALGFKYGKTSGKGTWDVSYVYEKLEADAVLGLLTDSNFGGGGTDAKGSIFKGTWALHENWSAKFTYFLNEFDLASGKPKDFSRLQLDLNFRYK
ncbi:MAG: putative porin [Proteobacteria bacterium]|nr:putative porin [Pseudomonadota bacterium]